MKSQLLAPLGAALWAASFSSLGLAQSPCEPMVGRLVSAQGKVEARADAASAWKSATLNDVFCVGNMVRVGERSRAALLLSNDTVLRLGQHTTLTLSNIETKQSSWLELLSGVAHFISRVPRALTVKTPFVNAAVEGTEFVVTVAGNEARVTVFEGRVWAQNEAGRLVLDSGQTAVAQAGQAPVARVVVRPRDAVQWALYYPPIFDRRLAQAPAAPWQKAVADSLDAYYARDTVKAFAAVESVPEPSEARYFTHRAALQLVVGRVAEARADIERARRLDSQNAHAIALQSVIALAQNEKDRALALAHQASELDSMSVPALVALSYAQQGLFDIAAATMSMERAIAQDREDPLVWARLAELHLSLGYLDRALDAAQAAVALNPRSAHAQSMLGFAYLTRIEIDNARRAFEQSITYDSTFPLARLGLGLAIIRTGDLVAGRREIEIAASLDPNNALVRSYLGKAYYEEKRDRLSESQLAMAKSLDDKDPTPWFYDAIRKQTENRPVEALHGLQRSIELNDNRAVYRSRLLLDEDRAVRSTSLARIYDDLGFARRALVEGTRSLSADPTNHSAHRFLSDTYARLPRQEIAQVSELLQAQLLQPININPVQPRLSIKGIDIVSRIGPAEAAFNEFTPLFERDRPQLTVAGIAGNNETYSDEAVLSGLLGRFSYSLGQFHYETDGFRAGSDIKHDIYNAFGQAALTSKVNVQFEYRQRDTEQGDTRLMLEPGFVPTERREREHDISRVGLHLAPSPRSDVIASFIYSDRRETLHNQDETSKVDTVDDRQGYEAEGQYLFREERFNLTVGGGAYRVDVESETSATIGPVIVDPCTPFGLPPCPMVEPEKTFTSGEKSDIDGKIVYAYTNLRFPEDFVWTFGLSYETYEEAERNFDLDKVNPKLGLQWDITDWLRLRMAYLRTLKRVLAVDQTIEPTQVAGFNQFFDDRNGTFADLYGVGIDAILTEGFYGGVEYTRRDPTQPNNVEIRGVKTIELVEREEELYRAYLYWTPHSNWSLDAEYRFERDRDALPIKELETNMVPIVIRYFGPQGFFAQFGSTFVSQKMLTSSGQRLRDNFAVVDAAIGYRFPKRRGIVSLGVGNLFDKEFRFQDVSFKTGEKFDVIHPFLPDRTFLARIVLNF